MAFALAGSDWLRNILVRLTPGNIPESLKAVEKKWKAIVPKYPLDYTFVDQDYDNLFRAQIRLSNLLKYFTILAVIIACLGMVWTLILCLMVKLKNLRYMMRIKSQRITKTTNFSFKQEI